MSQSIGNPVKRSAVDMERPDPATRLKLDPLATVPNDMDDATHAELDKEVFESFEVRPRNRNGWKLLLAQLAESSSGQIDSKYGTLSNAQDILEKQPGLLDMLEKSYDDRSFKNIRNLSTED